MDNIKEILKTISIEEKISFLRGVDNWTTLPLEKLNIKSIRMNDGPNGIRKEIDNEKGVFKKSYPSVCFPTASLMACSFNKKMMYQEGKDLAEEARDQKVNIVLGPGINIKRNPLCGRNFEYFSEDPYLSGELAKYYIKGVQDNGVGVSLKHFAVNSEEKDRNRINEVVDERALREIYLSAFEKCVKEAKPDSIMTSYNKVNGEFSSENHHLLIDILRNEWKYEGITISDWCSVNDISKAIKNGLDLEMPNSYNINYKKVLDDYKRGIIKEDEIDEHVIRLVTLFEKYQKNLLPLNCNYQSHHKDAVDFAKDSIVLLKNENNVLPLTKNETVLFAGEFINKTRFQGGGSSNVNPYRVSYFLNEIKKYSSHTYYARGYDNGDEKNSKKFINEAKNIAKKVDKVVLFLGLPDSYEYEGIDRKHASLPETQLELVKQIHEVNKNIIIVLENGSVVELPFINNVKGLLECYLGGEGINEAIASILYGETNPSGRLAETFFRNLKDVSIYNDLVHNGINNLHKDSIFVGYRYYGKNPSSILYPFGFGLSYSTFEYNNIEIDKDELKENEKLKVRLNVKNLSERDAKEVVQVYISKPNDFIFNAKRELKGFEKVLIKGNAEEKVEISLNYEDFRYFNVKNNRYEVQDGYYQVEVCKNSEQLIKSFVVRVYGTPLTKEKSPYYQKAYKYFDANIKDISEEEFFEIDNKLFKEEENRYVYDFNSSISLAINRGSKGAKKILSSLNKSKQFKNDITIKTYFLEAPLRQLQYYVGPILSDKELLLLLEILNDHKYRRNILKLLKNIYKNYKKSR